MKYINYIFASFILFFVPIYGLLISVGASIILDTVTGVYKSIRLEGWRSIRSRKLSNVISKMALYEVCIILLFVIDKYVLNEFVKHAFGFDFSQNYSKHNDIYSSKIIQKHFYVNFDLSLYESYVDMFAIYINSLLFSFYKTYNKSSPDFVNRVLIKTNTILNNELIFSMFQSTKILTYYNINYTDLFSNSKTLHLYDENTPVFSYFIIKTILFFNFNKFFAWCIQNNSNVFDFECNNKNKNNNKLTCNKKIKLFCNFIIQNYKDINLIYNLTKLQQFFINTNNNNFIFKTLRFSIYG